MEIKVLKKVLAANDTVANSNREFFTRNGIFAVNIMSSPGSGKTTIIEMTVKKLKGKIRAGVIAGDIASSLDAEKLSKLDIPVVQINTGPFGGDCHLEASWIRDAAQSIDMDKIDLLFIENVGNLVCPAEFDTGADKNVVVVSLPEGEEKPTKYPLMFRVSQLFLINKADLLPVLGTDTDLLIKNAKNVNPDISIIQLSAKTGEGFDEWIDWIESEVAKKKSGGKK
jgi:hydrogenase nickel incorporation protein HypB